MILVGIGALVLIGAISYTSGENLQGYLRPVTPASLDTNWQNLRFIVNKPVTKEPPPASVEAPPAAIPGGMTRAELIAYVAPHIPGLKANQKNCFKDTIGNKYENAICAMYQAGYINGTIAYGSTIQFRPNDLVSRGEAAKVVFFAYMYFENKKADCKATKLPLYQDVSPAMWFYVYLINVAQCKVVDIAPDPKSLFHPGDALTKKSLEMMTKNAINGGWIK